MAEAEHNRISRIVGLGVDDKDGHVRITRGDTFSVYLGSEAEHGDLQALCLRIERELQRRGVRLDELTPDAFRRMLAEME